MWGKKITGNFCSNIKQCKAELKRLRHRTDVQTVTEYDAVKKRLHLILDQREIFWRQRSKQLWLQSGDKNSKYFHASASKKRITNKIVKLKNSNGVWKEWNDGLEELIVDYYTELFSASQVDSVEVLDSVTSAITREQNLKLSMPVTDDEVKEALFQMHPDKSPGSDGMTLVFFFKTGRL